MKNVAAGALPGTERHLANARLFGATTLPLFDVETQPQDIKKTLYVAIGTERGMCGTISSSTVKAIKNHVETNKVKDYQVICYGKRSSAIANTAFGPRLILSAVEVKTRVPTFDFSTQLAEYILYQCEWDQLVIFYNEYESAARFHVRGVYLYKSDLAKAIAELQFPSYEIEAEESTIIDNLIEFKLASSLYLFMAENAASEQGARLQSMDTATKNCNTMVKEYERIFQGLRKTKITNELLILGVAAKLAKKK